MDVLFQKMFMQLAIWMFEFIDAVFGVFGTLAGIKPVNTDQGEMPLTQYFINQPTVYKAFLGVFICSIGVLAVCMVVAVIKSIINFKGGERKSHVKIVGQGLGSILVSLTMAMILVVGIGVSDLLLAQLNKAINVEGTTISQNIFGLSVNTSYILDEDNIQGLNRFEDQDGNQVCTFVAYMYDYAKDGDAVKKDPDNGLTIFLDNEGAEISWGDPFDDPVPGAYEGKDGKWYKLNTSELVLQPAVTGWREDPSTGEYYTPNDVHFSEVTPDNVFGVYGRSFPWIFEDSAKYEKYTGMVRLNNFNYLTAFLCGIIVCIALIGSMLGLVKRLYDLVLLILALPLISSTIPLDDGAKFKIWRETVISKIVLAYGSVFAVNIFMLITPFIFGINIGGGMTETVFKTFMVCGGALTISGGQLLFARLVGGSAEESREMAQSARTLAAGAATGIGFAKGAGRMAFGAKNANGQRVGGLLKGAGGIAGSLGGGALNAAGTMLGGQAYRGSRFAGGVSATQRALKGFSHGAGWVGEGTVGGAIGGAIGGAARHIGNAVGGLRGGSAAGTPGNQDGGRFVNGIGGAIGAGAHNRSMNARAASADRKADKYQSKLDSLFDRADRDGETPKLNRQIDKMTNKIERQTASAERLRSKIKPPKSNH